jgi:PAS domain S-box-containing protein
MSEVENQEVNDGKRNFNIESKVFSKAVDECFAGVIITDARLEDNPIVYCNKAFCEMTGYNPEEIIGRNCRFLQGPESSRDIIASIRNAIEKAEPIETKLVNYRKNGQPFWNKLLVSPVFDRDGKPAYFIGIQMDVTHEVETSRRFEKIKNEWIYTVDAIDDLILLTTTEGKILRVNKAVADLFGRNFKDIIGCSILELFDQASCEELELDKLFEVSKAEFTLGKNYYQISNHCISVCNPCGRQNQENICKNCGIKTESRRVHVIRNITEEKELNLRLEWLEKAFEQALDCVVITDINGFVEQVNKAFTERTGWQSHEIRGVNLFEVHFDPRYSKLIPEILSKVSKGEVWSGEYVSRGRNGNRHYEEASISSIKDKDGKIRKLLHIQRDVTERKRLEAIAADVNLAENIAYVFSGIRHEIGNPINTIKTILTVMRNNLHQWPKEKTAEYIETCLGEVERIEYLLKALKTFSIYEDLEVKSLKLYPFMEDFLKFIEKDFNRRGIQLSFQAEERCKKMEIKADPRGLYQVLLNIISNAIDALEGIEIPTVKIKLQRSGNKGVISIIDNGCGMSEAELKNVFKPFYTTKPYGTGLGLAISKKIVAKMNGEISILSEKANGTTVSLSFDLAQPY